jgi:hypothetical protein
MRPEEAIELCGMWRRLIDANRRVHSVMGIAHWKKPTVTPLLWAGARVPYGRPLDDLSEGAAVARFEVFARDVAQWHYETREPLGREWGWFEAPLEYGWTDAEATAAGWVRGPQSFGWRETVQHAGKVVVMQGTAQGGAAFDMAELDLVPR